MRSTLLAGVLFAVAYTQSPLFFSNQNQYFLHGAADAPGSGLTADWLTNTRDPTPLFSDGVATAFGGWLPVRPAAVVLFVYGCLLYWYVEFVTLLVRRLPFAPATPAGWAVAFALLLVTHAALFRWLSVRLTGVDYPWNFQCGVANQYVLGAGLQPSVFGILLVGSLAAFCNHRPWPAVIGAAAACAMHFTYLLPTVLIFAGYLVVTVRTQCRRAAGRLALGMAAVLLPVVAFNAVRFRPTDADTFAEAQRLLAEVRIPHHCKVEKWLDPVAGLQIAWVVLAVALVRRSPLGTVMAVAAGLSAALSVVTAVSDNHLLMLLFPWRVSAVLVPVATAVIIARVAAWAESRSRRAVAVVAGGIVVAAVAAGIAFPLYGIGYAMNEAERPLLDHVGRTRRPGDVYLIPTRVPAVAGGKRGSFSTTFTPPPRPGGNQIPVDLQRFRLATGAAVFIDFKAIPYADREVLEWWRRVQLAQRWYEEKAWASAATLVELREEGVTCVVVPADQPIRSPAYQQEYQDEAFRVYRLGP